MFSEACVENSVGGGETRQKPTPGQTRQTSPPGQTPHPRQTATVADSTHPTGMHSCFTLMSDPVARLCFKIKQSKRNFV